MKMIGNVSDWLSYAGGALIKVADSAGSTVSKILIRGHINTVSSDRPGLRPSVRPSVRNTLFP